MGKSKRKYDAYDDAENGIGEGANPPDSGSGPSVFDFVSPLKVDAFANTYRTTNNELDADEVYDEARLRSYFQAYPRPLGDPLTVYLELLAARGFCLTTGIAGDPVICVQHI